MAPRNRLNARGIVAIGASDGGTLWERRGGAAVRHRCRVGHVLSEEALWMALEALEERSELLGLTVDEAPVAGLSA